MIGKLERVPLREVWRREDQDFTRWLEENYDALDDVLDIGLQNVQREAQAGAFSVDLVGEDTSGSPVIIENQLEKSDHDHLGKLVTYLTAFEARTAVWIVAEPRPEHVRAITWLNESSAASFYLVKAEAVRIGESPPAPLLTVIVGPSEESREVGETKRDLAERHILRKRFWTALLQRAASKTNLHAHVSPGHYSWIGTGAGISGLAFNYGVRQHEAQVELYIDRGKDSDEENRSIFDQLATARQSIESSFGGPLVWDSVEGRRSCRIGSGTFTRGGYRDESDWPEIQDEMIDAMIRLEKALRPHINRLKV